MDTSYGKVKCCYTNVSLVQNSPAGSQEVSGIAPRSISAVIQDWGPYQRLSPERFIFSRGGAVSSNSTS